MVEFEPDRLADAKVAVCRNTRLDQSAGGFDSDHLVRSKILAAVDGAAQRRGVAKADMLGPNPKRKLAFRHVLPDLGNGNVDAVERDGARTHLQARVEAHEVHRWRA